MYKAEQIKFLDSRNPLLKNEKKILYIKLKAARPHHFKIFVTRYNKDILIISGKIFCYKIPFTFSHIIISQFKISRPST